MKAVIWTAYGAADVLQLQDVEKPTPKDNELLVRVRAATVTAGDCEMRSLKFPLILSLPMRLYVGFKKPTRVTILGQELAGEIEAVGKDVKLFKPGDQIFAATYFNFGAYAEYNCLPENSAATLKPSNISYEEAAAVPTGGLNALHFLRKANIESGQSVLINGAGGSIGTFAIQLAKTFGAEVTAVDSTAKLEMMRSIGADHLIDFTGEDFTKSGKKYDVIFDVAGKSSFAGGIRSLKKNGVYLLANPTFTRTLRGWWISKTSSKKVIGGTADYKKEDLGHLKELLETGKIKTVIDRSYPLEETAEAHRYVEQGLKLGNVVITTHNHPLRSLYSSV
jgi:2-desacetyl-2-hydroxyethyl bacteriochlorophyllide A dehydrogenase